MFEKLADKKNRIFWISYLEIKFDVTFNKK